MRTGIRAEGRFSIGGGGSGLGCEEGGGMSERYGREGGHAVYQVKGLCGSNVVRRERCGISLVKGGGRVEMAREGGRPNGKGSGGRL